MPGSRKSSPLRFVRTYKYYFSIYFCLMLFSGAGRACVPIPLRRQEYLRPANRAALQRTPLRGDGLSLRIGRPTFFRVAATGGAEKPPVKPDDKTKEKKKLSGLQKITSDIVKRQYTKEYAEKVLKSLKELNMTDDEEIKKLFLARGLQKLIPRGSAALLNACATYICFIGYAYFRAHSEDLGVLAFTAQAVSLTICLNFGVATITDAVVLVQTFAAALIFGTNVDSFMEAVREQAGVSAAPASGAAAGAAASGLPQLPVLSGLADAVSAVRVVEALTKTRDAARARFEAGDLPAASDLSAKESYFKLAALLAVARAEASVQKFDPDEWNMSEAEAVRIARVFNQYDSQLDGRLRPADLRKLTRDLGQELSEEEVVVAMGFLDEDQSGTIEFNEFVAFWSGIRVLPSSGKEQPWGE